MSDDDVSIDIEEESEYEDEEEYGDEDDEDEEDNTIIDAAADDIIDNAIDDIIDDTVDDNSETYSKAHKVADTISVKRIKTSQFLDPPLMNKNIVLEKSNKPRTVIIVAPEDRKTSDQLQKSERAGLLAIRSKQIDKNGCPEYLSDVITRMKRVKINISANDIAEEELMSRKCPLLLRREIGINNKDELIVEEWNPNEMKIHI